MSGVEWFCRPPGAKPAMHRPTRAVTLPNDDPFDVPHHQVSHAKQRDIRVRSDLMMWRTETGKKLEKSDDIRWLHSMTPRAKPKPVRLHAIETPPYPIVS